MTIATHPVAPEDVMALLDGELSAEQVQSVSVHLKQCAECAVFATELRSTSVDVSAWKVEACPEKLRNGLTDAARDFRAGVKIKSANIFVRASFWSWKQWTAGIGAAGALLMLGFAFVDSGSMRKAPRSHPQAQGVSVDNAYVGKLPPEESKRSGRPGFDAVVVQPLAAPVPQGGTAGGVPGGIMGAEIGAADGRVVTQMQEPMIARTVSLSIIVKDFAAARANLDVILARHHGYAAQLNASTAENAARSLNGSLRVPAGELGSAVSELKALGRVQNESQNGEEVTQQHADLVARLKNSRETERRLQAILAERTGKISDVLAVEQEIARVRGEIEQMEAEQKSLEHRVEFATVDLNLTEEYKAQLVIPPLSVGSRLHNALVEGYRDATETLLGIVLFFAEYTLSLLLWVLILGLPVVYVWRRYRRSLATV